MAVNLPPLPPTSNLPPLPTVPSAHFIMIAARQRQLLWGIVALMFLSLFANALPILFLPLIVIQVLLIYRLGKALGLPSLWLWTIGCLVPYLGILVLLLLNQKATTTLRSAGFKVGFMGAKIAKGGTHV